MTREKKTLVWALSNAGFIVALILLCVFLHCSWDAHIQLLQEKAEAETDAAAQFSGSLGAGLTAVIATFYDIIVSGGYAFAGLFTGISALVVGICGKNPDRLRRVRWWVFIGALMKIFAFITSVLGALFSATVPMMAACIVAAVVCLAGAICDFVFRKKLRNE